MTAREFAEAVNAAYTTVMGWLKDQAVPGAIFDDSSPRGGVWFIPESAVDQFKQESRRRGRPRKPKPEIKVRPRKTGDKIK